MYKNNPQPLSIQDLVAGKQIKNADEFVHCLGISDNWILNWLIQPILASVATH